MSPSQPSTFQWSSETDTGPYRPHNEDARRMAAWTGQELVLLPKHGEWDFANGDLLLAVSDGMGGALYGERASHVSIEAFFEHFTRQRLQHSHEKDPPEIAPFLKGLVELAHDRVNSEATRYPECKGMGATLTVLWLRSSGSWWITHVGDSRCYQLRVGTSQLEQITHDHTFAGHLFRQGKINERELRTHPTSNALTQALGGGLRGVQPQIKSGSFSQGDRFLLCSDGLTDGLWDKHLLAAMKERENPVSDLMPTLLEDSLRGSGRDNITLIAGEAGLAESPR